MPKMKTKSSAKKRFKVTASGKVKFKKAFMRHMQMNKPKSMKRKARHGDIMFDADQRKVLDFYMPYARVRKRRKTTAAKSAEGGK